MITKDEEVFREQRHMTHFNRYAIVADKLKQFTTEMKQIGSMETIDYMRYGQLMEEAHEALLDIYKDSLEMLKMCEEAIK